jgi:hypothetical protein
MKLFEKAHLRVGFFLSFDKFILLFYTDLTLKNENNMKSKYKVLMFMITSVLLFSGCSPVDRVKWSKIDLLGNQVPVRRIVNGLSGINGEAVWMYNRNIIYQDCDFVTANIKGRSALFVVSFEYNRKSGECKLIEYKVNGKNESPLFIYRFLTTNRYRFLPDFMDYFF